MPQKYRLTVADLRAFRADRRLSSTYFSLSIGKAAQVGAACVISKKIAARAVDRNRVKRRCRAALLPLLPALSPARYVFYAKKEAVRAESGEIARDLQKLVERLA